MVELDVEAEVHQELVVAGHVTPLARTRGGVAVDRWGSTPAADRPEGEAIIGLSYFFRNRRRKSRVSLRPRMRDPEEDGQPQRAAGDDAGRGTGERDAEPSGGDPAGDPGRSPGGRGGQGELQRVGRQRPAFERSDLARQQRVEDADVEDRRERCRQREGQVAEDPHQGNIEDQVEADRGEARVHRRPGVLVGVVHGGDVAQRRHEGDAGHVEDERPGRGHGVRRGETPALVDGPRQRDGQAGDEGRGRHGQEQDHLQRVAERRLHGHDVLVQGQPGERGQGHGAHGHARTSRAAGA